MSHIDYIPSSEFLQSLEKKERHKKHSEWRNKFPEDWIELFIQQGIVPFLKHYGYRLGFSIEHCIQYTNTWAFLHLYTKDKYECKVWAHNGTNNEYEWFHYKISQESWSNLIDTWKVEGFLDDSDAGLRQSEDLAWFIWHLVDLNNSREHINYLELFEDSEDKYDDYSGHNNEEMNAYSGDRRTY